MFIRGMTLCSLALGLLAYQDAAYAFAPAPSATRMSSSTLAGSPTSFTPVVNAGGYGGTPGYGGDSSNVLYNYESAATLRMKIQNSSTVSAQRKSIVYRAFKEYDRHLMNSNAASFYGVPWWDLAKQWCSEFVSWVYRHSGPTEATTVVRVADFFTAGSTDDFEKLFKRYGAWYDRTGMRSYTPQPGDWMGFDTDNDGLVNHSGMVVGVSLDTSTIYFIEGNSGPDGQKTVQFGKLGYTNMRIRVVGNIGVAL